MYPYERSLVKRLQDKPFALIGVNSDTNLSELETVVKKERITWRSFWNGPDGTQGPISKAWNVRGWPTLFLLDAEGKIRGKNLEEEDLDEAIDALLAEMEK